MSEKDEKRLRKLLKAHENYKNREENREISLETPEKLKGIKTPCKIRKTRICDTDGRLVEKGGRAWMASHKGVPLKGKHLRKTRLVLKKRNADPEFQAYAQQRQKEVAAQRKKWREEKSGTKEQVEERRRQAVLSYFTRRDEKLAKSSAK